ncbi:type VII secretion-associated serine protease mycosin [Paractinoplanes lichenicola]|uniref:Type VII secretion-associated serine protease mycosin n=1 Tax=Paractinoplanes lichenicola TaxID=2802976 RepID=A0ABS1VTI1_9ACTN|nr:type VII secretion-associated serine protease mycosin [Actinoplanes lichenicola]MBL7257775.1 type VII secretion-associated serine protease mycosin [Actinoplanes lichenicola]
MVWRRLVAVTAVAAALLTVPAPAQAKVVCQTVAQPKPVASGVPLEDQMYDPKRLAPFATGAGVRVAVIDSGVDATHPQLRGHVTQGADFLHGERSGRQDCNGHGTAVASIIGAIPARNTGFQGLAPDAVIVPVRISEQQEIDGKAVGDRGTPAQFAEAIDWAVDQGDADVINLSLVMTDDNDAVRRAVERAVARGVVVVAAAGNKAQDGNPTPFPAKYDGVIGVGATTPNGVRAPFSQRGDYVDIVAMGAPVTAAALADGHAPVQGTSFSAPFVAATAALLKQRFPNITPQGVERRLTATADPAPGGGPRSLDYGFGALNPYRALTANLAPAAGPAPPPEVVNLNDPAAAALEARRDRSRNLAMIFAAVGVGLVLLLGLIAAIVRQGRRRGWSPATGGHTD